MAFSKSRVFQRELRKWANDAKFVPSPHSRAKARVLSSDVEKTNALDVSNEDRLPVLCLLEINMNKS
jgi:hypothetical protein